MLSMHTLSYHVEYRLRSGEPTTCPKFLAQISELNLTLEQQEEISAYLDRIAFLLWSTGTYLVKELHLDEYTTKVTYQISEEGGIVSYDDPEIDFIFTFSGWPIICYIDLYTRSQAC